jgi:hypothetical protein
MLSSPYTFVTSLHQGAGWVILGVFLLGLLLLRVAKTERGSILTALGLFALSLGGVVLAGLLRQNGLTAPADYLWPFSIFAEGMCVIYLVDLAIFRVVMPAVRVRSPRILQDIVTGLAYVV